MTKYNISWMLPCLVALFISCADRGGIGHEGEARISGQLVFTDGSYASHTQVELYPVENDPVKGNSVVPVQTTDVLGTYSFSQVSPGRYTICAVNRDNKTRTLIHGINVTRDSLVIISSRILRDAGSMKVFIPASLRKALGYIYIPGTRLYTRLNSSSEFAQIDSVPAGVVPQVSYSSENEAVSQVIRYDVAIQPGSATTVYNSSWKYCRKIGFNTTVSGAGVSGNVTNFPVCIKLSSKNMPFDQAKSDGSDIRFTKQDNTPLSYEIERWDAAKWQADIWVRVDTVYGNSSSQEIMMYWGNADAVSESGSDKVFDTSNGYVAVWHMGKQVTDATINAHNSVYNSAKESAGAIGEGKKFNGSDSIVIPGLLGTPGSLTLSAWAQLDSTTSGAGSEILTVGDAVLIRMDYEKDSIGTIGSIHRSEGTYFANNISSRFHKKTGWHFITFTIDQTSLSRVLYIDGAQVNSTNTPAIPVNYEGVGLNTCIGKHGNKKTEFGFIGRIDEVRVYRKPVSVDYVKLCYMNQKENDFLLIFK